MSSNITTENEFKKLTDFLSKQIKDSNKKWAIGLAVAILIGIVSIIVQLLKK